MSTPDLSPMAVAIHAALGEHTEATVRLYDSLDSTNTEAKRHAAEETAPVLYVARTQTEGRGRLGRSFHSPADTGLYMTLAYTTDRPLSETVAVTALAAVAAVYVIEQLTDKRPRIKWVNDLYLQDAKMAGILTEAVTLPDEGGHPRTRMLVGIGINLTTATFTDGLRAPAVSLFEAGEAPTVSQTFVGTLAGRLTGLLLALVAETPSRAVLPNGEDCLEFYRCHLLYVGEQVICTRGNDRLEGILRGVDDTYSLLLETDRGMESPGSGEISVSKRRAGDTLSGVE